MSRRLLTDADRQTILDEFARQGGRGTRGSITRTAKASGWDRGTVYAVCCPHRGQTGEKPPESETLKETAEGASLEFVTDKPVITLEDAIAAGKVDLATWFVKDWERSSWQAVVKLKRDGKETGHVKTLTRVKLKLARILPKPHHDALDALVARIAKHAPVYSPSYRTPADPHLLMVGLFDVHFGRLCWPAETGQAYDLRIAEQLYRNAVTDLLAASSGYEIGEVLFCIGSDLLHIDNPQSTTTAGTYQDSDGRLAKIVEVAEAAVIWAIERAAEVAPVRVVWVPGNHDTVTSYFFARTIAAWFRQHPGVTVDCGPTTRKYHRYGATLLGITHGDREKRSELPIIMATERPGEWAGTTCREWLIGHLHHSKASHSTPVDGQGGVTVRTLRCLAAADFWHSANGYLATDRAAEAYIYSHATGYTGHFLARPRLSA